MGTEHFRGNNGRRPYADRERKKQPQVPDPTTTKHSDSGFITLGGLKTFHPGPLKNVYVDGLRVKRPARVNHVDGAWLIPVFREKKAARPGRGK